MLAGAPDGASGAYSCSPPSSASARWTCQQLGKAGVATKNKILDFYTPSHWIVFLREFALAAGFAGDKVGSSATTVTGFSMKYVDFQARARPLTGSTNYGGGFSANIAENPPCCINTGG
jgi:hypothetical protein